MTLFPYKHKQQHAQRTKVQQMPACPQIVLIIQQVQEWARRLSSRFCEMMAFHLLILLYSEKEIILHVVYAIYLHFSSYRKHSQTCLQKSGYILRKIFSFILIIFFSQTTICCKLTAYCTCFRFIYLSWIPI